MPSAAQLDLQRIARRAASDFLTGGVELTPAIQKLASEENLNGHQVRRVCEMANRLVHTELYQRSPANDRVVNFPLADAGAILETEKKAEVIEWAPSMDDSPYFPGKESVPEDFLLEKVAEVESTAPPNWTANMLLTRELMDSFLGEVAAAEGKLNAARRLFKEAAVQALDEGYTVGDLISALAPYSPGSGFLKTSLEPVVALAQTKGVIVKAGSVDLRIPNPRNILVERFRYLVKCGEVYLTARHAHEEAKGLHSQCVTAYKEVQAN